MRTQRITAVLLAFAWLSPTNASAGDHADKLAKCLVESTSQRDRIELVRWMFSAASLHPAVKPLSSVSEAQLDNANKVIADLVVRLLTDSCRAEAESALQHEGATTLETAFSVLGQVAGTELFSSPEVAVGLAGLERHMDAEKLKSLSVPE